MDDDTERNLGRSFLQDTETALNSDYRKVDNYKEIRDIILIL